MTNLSQGQWVTVIDPKSKYYLQTSQILFGQSGFYYLYLDNRKQPFRCEQLEPCGDWAAVSALLSMFHSSRGKSGANQPVPAKVILKC